MCHNLVMIKVNVFEIKARLSEYLDRVASGDRVVIYRHRKPVAELRPIEEGPSGPRPIGPLPGRPVFKIPAAFFEELQPEALDLWEGKVPSKSSIGAKSAVTKSAGRKRRASRHKSR
jgi:prevent-host-death family protein